MSSTAIHRRQPVHVPWMTTFAVAVAVAVCAALLILANRPATQTPTGQAEVAPAAVAVDTAAVPLPENPAARRHLIAQVKARAAQTEQSTYPRNHVIAATAGTFTAPAPALRRYAADIPPKDPHPFNHFPSEP